MVRIDILKFHFISDSVRQFLATIMNSELELTLNSKQKCYKDVDVFSLYHFGKLNFGTSEMT